MRFHYRWLRRSENSTPAPPSAILSLILALPGDGGCVESPAPRAPRNAAPVSDPTRLRRRSTPAGPRDFNAPARTCRISSGESPAESLLRTSPSLTGRLFMFFLLTVFLRTVASCRAVCGDQGVDLALSYKAGNSLESIHPQRAAPGDQSESSDVEQADPSRGSGMPLPTRPPPLRQPVVHGRYVKFLRLESSCGSVDG